MKLNNGDNQQNKTSCCNACWVTSWFVVITVGLGLICVLLVTALILLYIHQTAERDQYFISSEEKSWSDSRRFCRSRGGDLVIINTEEEQKYISSIVNENVWIGLSDAEKERNMKWVDNTPLNKGFWDDGEPNDYSGNENCVEIIHTKPILSNWNDFACSVMKKWICEK
ncbi:putative C-type lectin domain family 4 member E [Triplophysa rosa]|uniref:C-type lectin domain family 4 member E n=1 Tax=Triplophysa rosa TaxID=992332 RepID=A0A9W7WZ83_TRIRA|nr:putative C-type lectin domain family 4 member E [Triplophysa rosa]